MNSQSTRNKFKSLLPYKLLVAVCALIFSLSASSQSYKALVGEKEIEIISNVIQAYGSSELVNAKSIKIVDYNKGPWPGESEHPGTPEIWRINEELVIDFEKTRKSLLSYRAPRTTLDLEKWVHDGDKTIMYDILHEKYSTENWANYQRLGGSMVRSSDTLQAKRLYNELKSAEYIGDEYYRGKVHQKLNVTLTSNAKFTYFIDKNSGLIRKILRKHPRAGEMLYIFSNHQKTNGLTFARDLNFFVNGELRLTSVERNVELNPNLADAFRSYSDFTPWGETFNYPGMHVEKLSERIYQAGKGRSLTVFVEQSDYYIAMGAANTLTENFTAIKKLTKNNKPIKYFIVTHHHNSNLIGLDNAVALGAKLVLAESHKETIIESLSSKIADDNLMLVRDREPLQIGNIKLYDIATAHSKHYLLAYIPTKKMIIAEDHYGTNLKVAKPRIYHDMVRFRKSLDKLKIDVEKLIDIRGWRQLSIDELLKWTNEFTLKKCPPGYEICANG